MIKLLGLYTVAYRINDLLMTCICTVVHCVCTNEYSYVIKCHHKMEGLLLLNTFEKQDVLCYGV